LFYESIIPDQKYEETIKKTLLEVDMSDNPCWQMKQFGYLSNELMTKS